jgi:hypothetical protein
MQVGLIAGSGELPIILCKDAKERGYRVVTVALDGLASSDIEGLSDVTRWVGIGKLGDLIATLNAYHVTDAVMAGKVPKALLYKTKITPDMRTMKLLFSLKDRSDDALLRALAAELEKEGIHLLDTATFSPHLLAPRGVMSMREPTKSEWKDIEYGWRIAREVGRLDIGQTIVVKDRAVTAVEAIEGTDETILRGGAWAKGGSVVVKVSKPQQNMKLDVPVVGLTTMSSMVTVKAAVLAVEAGRTIMLQKDSLLNTANAEGIAVVGVSEDSW